MVTRLPVSPRVPCSSRAARDGRGVTEQGAGCELSPSPVSLGTGGLSGLWTALCWPPQIRAVPAGSQLECHLCG